MKDYFGYAPALIIPRAISAIIILVAARYLSPEEVGLYALVISVGEYFDTIFCRWIRSGYSRLYYVHEKEGRKIEFIVLMLLLPGVVVSIPSAFIYAYFSPSLDAKWAALLCLYVTANVILYQGLQFLRVRGSRNAYITLEVCRSVAGFVIALSLCAVLSPEYELILTGTQGVTFLAAIWLLVRMLSADSDRAVNRDVMMDLLRYSSPLLVTYFLAGTALVLDRVLLEMLAEPSVLGIYAVSYQLARPMIDILFNVVNIGGFPKLVAAYESEGDIGAQRVLYQKNVAISLVVFPVLLFFVVNGGHLTSILLTEEFSQFAPTAVALIAVASFLRGWVRFLVDQIFLLRRTPLDQVWNLLPSIAVTLLCGVVLIPLHGVYGAGVTVLLGAATEAAVAFTRARARLRFRVFGKETIIIFASSLFGSVLIFICGNIWATLGLVASSVMVCLVYALAMKKFGVLKALK